MYQDQRLPVDCHHPHQWAFNNQLPNVVPYIPQIACSRTIQPYLQLIVGVALLDAQNHAGQNPLRTFYFNMLSNNNWQNQDFIELIQSVAEVAEFLAATQRKDLPQAIHEAAAMMNSIQSSMMVEKYPAIQQFLSQEQIYGSRQWLERFQGMARNIKAFQDQQTMPPQYGNFRPNPGYPPQPYGQPMSGYYQPNNPSMVAAGGMYGGGNFIQHERTPGVPGGSDSFSGGLSRSNRRNDDRMDSLSIMQDQKDPTVTYRQTPWGEDFTHDTTNEAPAMADNPEGRWNSFYSDDGKIHYTPAAISNLKVSKTEEHPYRVAYKPSEQCLFHGQHRDGTVEEIFVPWSASNDMDYLKNEIRSDLRAAIPRDPHAPKHVPNFKLLENLAPISKSMLGVAVPKVQGQEPAQDIPNTTSDVRTSVLDGSSLDDLLQLGRLETHVLTEEATEAGNPERAMCTEQYGDILKVVPCSADDPVLIDSYLEYTNFKDLIESLKAPGDTHLSEPLTKEVTARLTDEVNVALKQHLQIGITIDNVMDDYDDLMKMLEETYGEKIAAVFKEHEIEIIERAINILEPEEVKAYLKKIFDTEEKVEAASKRSVIFTNRVAITYVNWYAEDLDIAFTGSGAVSEATMPNLHKAVKAMFKRTEDMDKPFNDHLMETKDGVLLEFHKGWLGKDFFLISRVR